MKYYAEINGETGQLLCVPSWFKRLFGAKPRQGAIHYTYSANGGKKWYWKNSERAINQKALLSIECPEVSPLPKMKVLSLLNSR